MIYLKRAVIFAFTCDSLVAFLIMAEHAVISSTSTAVRSYLTTKHALVVYEVNTMLGADGVT